MYIYKPKFLYLHIFKVNVLVDLHFACMHKNEIFLKCTNLKFRLVSESHHWQSSYLVITLFSPLPALYKGSLTIHTSNLSKKICYRMLLITSILIVHVSRASENGWIQIFPMLSLMPKSLYASNWYRSLFTMIHQSL